MTMKKFFFFLKSLIIFIGLLNISISQDKQPLPTENFYNKSLHFTNKGITYLYSKEQGGLEKLSGISAVEIGCDKPECHIKSCDVCHLKLIDGKYSYSLEIAKSQEACKRCHPPKKNDPDVHVQKGMKCMDCHSIREIHGDGVEYTSYNQPGAMDTKCEKCHGSLQKSMSHTIHKDKLDCNPCHIREMEVCHNCHIGVTITDKKSVYLPMKNIFFLVNHNGKVKLANYVSYVYENRTMITFAPAFNHSVMREGRKCKDCHNTQITRDITNNKFKPIRWEKDTLQNIEGFIPVVEGMKWDLDFLNHEKGKWIPIKDALAPMITYAGYCSPLTREQFEKLAKPRGTK
jgi:hypothetical protein